jgi:hypothetical protein
MPPRPSDVEPRGPADFAHFLAAKEPVLLVGGQAVNLWALYYKDRVADLVPFVSRDVDVLGDRETLEELAKLAGAKPQFFPMKPPTNEVGVVIAKDANGVPMLIQVLRGVLGVKNEDLKHPAYTMKLGGGRVEVPGPIALLKAKIANVTSINQTGRQDGRHVQIMCRVMPAYLENLRDAAASGRMDERVLIGFLEQLAKIVSTKTARRVFNGLQIDPRALFAELEPGKLSRLAAFVKKRLPQVGLG